MIVCPSVTMKLLMTEIVQATHGLTDTVGEKVTLPTIAEAQLRMAALVALQIATGETVHGGDKPLRIKMARPHHGMVEVIE